VSIERRRALKWLLVPASGLLVPGAFANAGRVASARVWPAQEYTRVILEGPTPVPHQVATVANPPRLVLDLDGVEMSSALADLQALIGASDPYIAGVRIGRPTASVLREARPAELAEDRLTLEFPSSASFHLKLAEDPKNATLLQDALYEITGRKLALAFELGEHAQETEAAEEPLGEDEILELVKETFDARELNDGEDA